MLSTVAANNTQFFHLLLLVGEVLKSGPFSLVRSFSYFALSIKVSKNLHHEGGFPQDKMLCSKNSHSKKPTLKIKIQGLKNNPRALAAS